MTNLDKLYASIQTFKELGIELPEALIEQTNKLEEDIIKNEIIPVLTDAIDTIINKIQRELVLVVDYLPNEPLSIRLSRKRNFSDQAEIKILTPDAPFQHNIGTIKRDVKNKKPWSNLRVITLQGKIIENQFAYQTLLEIVKLAGIEKVRSLEITQAGVPLVSNKLDDIYENSQKEIIKGIYVMTCSSTEIKKQQIEDISKAFKLGLKVEIVNR